MPAGAAPLAAGVELLHLATLVHDDVMDDAGLRRGAPTLQARYGKRVAVICGDWLLAAALRTAAALNDRERFLSLRLPGSVSYTHLDVYKRQEQRERGEGEGKDRVAEHDERAVPPRHPFKIHIPSTGG